MSDPGGREKTGHPSETEAGYLRSRIYSGPRIGEIAKFWNQTDFGHLFLNCVHLNRPPKHSTPPFPRPKTGENIQWRD